MAKGTGLTERPIIFSAPMVRALLEGRKTQTRRVFVPPAPFDQGDDITVELATGSIAPKWAAGDRLWVREGAARKPHLWVYTADDTEIGWPGRKALANRQRDTSPSIHLPRSASRLTLAVTEVRVERLQGISEADAVAEGVEPEAEPLEGKVYFRNYEPRVLGSHLMPKASFSSLWASLHGADAWDANPWVAAISFEVHRANIDAIPAARAALAERGGADPSPTSPVAKDERHG